MGQPGDLNEKCIPYRLKYLDTWPPVDDAVCREVLETSGNGALVGSTLLKAGFKNL